jgi:O-methyltransferase
MNLSTRLLYGLGIPLSPLKPFFKNFRGQWSSYRPFFQPWRESSIFQAWLSKTNGLRLYSDEIFYNVFQFARVALRAEGNVWECGVYRGASSLLLAELIRLDAPKKKLRLFDTFSGLPEQSELDKYKAGELGDTSVERVQALLRDHASVQFHVGRMPETFGGLEDEQISFALIDVDQRQSTSECLRFVYPRLQRGGAILIDDYGRPGTYGCRIAVDEYLAEIAAPLIVLQTGQAVILK